MLEKFIFNGKYLFNQLSEDDKLLFYRVMREKNYRKNQPIYTDGTVPTGIFFVRKGKVKKYQVDNDGREQIIYIYTAGEFFGYTTLLSNDCYGSTTQAIENSVIAFISKEDYLNILAQSDEAAKSLIKDLSHELEVMSNLLTTLSQRTVRERVALNLLILHKKYESDMSQDRIYITLPRADLANLVGTAKETLARILHDFREDHLINIEGKKIQLRDLERLSKITNISR